MRAIYSVFLTGLICASFTRPATAEELNQIFTKVNQLVQEKNYTKAMEELTWARKEIEKMHQARLAEVLPSEVNGFKGEAVQFAAMMGISNIEREYRSGEKSIKVAVTGASTGDGLGGLAGLAKMGMMMGGAQPGVEQFRIDGRSATLNTENSQPELTVFLESGSMISMTGVNGVDASTLKKFGESLKLSDLDTYLKGAK